MVQVNYTPRSDEEITSSKSQQCRERYDWQEREGFLPYYSFLKKKKQPKAVFNSLMFLEVEVKAKEWETHINHLCYFASRRKKYLCLISTTLMPFNIFFQDRKSDNMHERNKSTCTQLLMAAKIVFSHFSVPMGKQASIQRQ